MAQRIEFFYASRDGVTQIHATQWLPEERPAKAILQIVHGMKEYIDRYDSFARYIADRGFIVVGEDHLGHGRTATDKSDYGYFAANNAEIILVKDVHRLKKLVQEEHPGLPYFIYGFSMGSFIARQYLTMYGEGIDGAIIGGTGWYNGAALDFGKAVSALLGLIHSDRYVSKFLEKQIFGKYNDRIENKRTDFDWLSTDDSAIDRYVKDKWCGFPFTVNGYATLFKIIKYVQKPENAKRVPHNLPVIFMSGLEDPAGSYGEGVKKAARHYMLNGMENVSIKLYENMRHELHNETKKHIVYLDILEWLESLL